MNLTIGITTYSRPDLLETMAASLYECEGIELCNVRVYDDDSPVWSGEYLRKVFPEAKEIVRRKKNLGADGNMYQMFLDFLATGDDLLLIADSDLIFRPDMLPCLINIISASDGIISLYNSAVHPSTRECSVNGTACVEKEHIGAAGTVITKELVTLVTRNVPASSSYDWDWSRFLRERKIRLLVTKESLIQHIGVHGQNSSSFVTEYGLHFYPGSRSNEVALVDFFECVLQRKDELIRSYRMFKPLRYPLRSINILFGKVCFSMRRLFRYVSLKQKRW